MEKFLYGQEKKVKKEEFPVEIKSKKNNKKIATAITANKKMELTCSKCGNLQKYNPHQIKKLREKLKVSQSELAKITGIPQQTISRIERGTGDPAFSKVMKIFNFLLIEQQ